MNILRAMTPVFVTLAAVAIILSFHEKPAKKTFDESDFDTVISDPIATIDPVELAQFIKNQTNAYWLIDLRDSSAFIEYHVPTAVQMSAAAITGIPARINEHIFLYTTHEREAVQAYQLLYFRGYFNVKVMAGGIEVWKNKVLFPNLADLEPEEIGKRSDLARFFGGQPVDKNAPSALEAQPVIIKPRTSRDGC